MSGSRDRTSPALPPSRSVPVEVRADADIAVQRLLPLTDLLVLQGLIAVGVVVALKLSSSGWLGAAAGLVVGLLVVVRVRGANLPRWIGRRWDYQRDRRDRSRRHAPAEAFDAEGADGAQVGFRWDGAALVSLIKIDDNPQAMTIMEPATTVSGEMVPLRLLVECLRQFDITLASIDVLSHGARSYGNTDIATVYDAVLGPLPAIAHRSVWIAVRLDPSRCAEAVQRRGGGRDGVLRTAATATRRVAHRLTEAGLRPRILTAAEILAATNQLSDGVSLTTIEETWDACRHGRFGLCSFAVEREMLTTEGLGLLWTVPSYSTTVCVTLADDTDGDGVLMRGLVRFDTEVSVPLELPGLVRLRGQQFAALAATLPVAQPGTAVGQWISARRDTAAHALAVPASGCGQVIGADSGGRAVALPLFGPQIARVQICGTLHLAQQVVLRSLALGARVLVHSRRPGRWRDMVDAVGRAELLWVVQFDRGELRAGAGRNYSVEVFDGVAERPVRVGVTAILVSPPYAQVSSPVDVTLESMSIENATVRVSTRAGSVVVTMVATEEEMRYIKASANDFD